MLQWKNNEPLPKSTIKCTKPMWNSQNKNYICTHLQQIEKASIWWRLSLALYSSPKLTKLDYGKRYLGARQMQIVFQHKRFSMERKILLFHCLSLPFMPWLLIHHHCGRFPMLEIEYYGLSIGNFWNKNDCLSFVNLHSFSSWVMRNQFDLFDL